MNKIEEQIWLSDINLVLPFKTFDKYQRDAFQEIVSNKGLLAVLPTSYGKTILAVAAAKYDKNIKEMKTMILAPLRSLTTEHIETMKEYDLKTMIDNGEHSKDVSDYTSKDYDVVISTYEKADAIIRHFKDDRQTQRRDIVFRNINTIVIDEIHSVEDSSRGVNLESFIMSVKRLFPHIRIIGLSATIGNYERFAEWLNVPYVHAPSSARPVPLEINFYEVQSFMFNDQFDEKLVNLENDINNHPNAKRMIAVTSVMRTKQLVMRLCGIKDKKIPIGDYMRNYGMAWHYSGSRGMSEDDRMAVEWAYQLDEISDDDNYYYERENRFINRKNWLFDHYNIDTPINTIVCTPTLIVGRNLPVTYIDVFDHKQFTYSHGPELIGANRLQQTIGRAGRRKYAKGNPDYKGIATIYSPINDLWEMRRNALYPFDIVSHLRSRLSEKILAWVNSRIVKSRDDIRNFLKTAFDDDIANNENLINKKLKFLLDFRFLIEDSEHNLLITSKGLQTIHYYVQPETVVKWGQLVKKTIESKKPTKISHFIMHSMNVEEYISNIVILTKDQIVIENFANVMNIADVKFQAVKTFMFCFPNYSRNKLNLKSKDYIIPESESISIRKQFERLINAFYEIYKKTKLKRTLLISKYMISSGIFNTKIAVLMSINGIGATYATRLLEKDIDSPEKLVRVYKTNKPRLLSIMQIPVLKLNKIMTNYMRKKKR